MALQVTLRVEGVAETLHDLDRAVQYLQDHQQIVEFSYDEGTLQVAGVSIAFPWEPQPSGAAGG